MNNEDKVDNSTYFVYREAETVDELEALFRLRYRVYGSCRLARFVHQTEYGFEVEAYDFRSRHFGVFEVIHGVQKPVGYLRVVEDRDLSDQPTLRGLESRYPELFSRANRSVGQPFPVMSYSADSEALLGLYGQMLANGERAVEPTRMALDPDCRKLSLARFLFECSNAIYFYAMGFDYAIACCDSTKKAFYHIYHWDHIPGTVEGDFAGLGVSSTVLLGSRAAMPLVARARLARMAEQYKATGRISSVREEQLQPQPNTTAMSAQPCSEPVARCA
jgi:hypothetical protein